MAAVRAARLAVEAVRIEHGGQSGGTGAGKSRDGAAIRSAVGRSQTFGRRAAGQSLAIRDPVLAQELVQVHVFHLRRKRGEKLVEIGRDE